MRRGFKAEAERLAVCVRHEMGLSPHDRLDPLALAAHLEIDAIPLTDLAASGANPRSIWQLTRNSPEDFSALTIPLEDKYLIVFNPAHSEGRNASNLAHELAHVLLKHQAGRALGPGGCRYWTDEMEDEANYLAGALLVPKDAAIRAAVGHRPIGEAASYFGVSVPMMRYRMNISGGSRIAQRARPRRRAR